MIIDVTASRIASLTSTLGSPAAMSTAARGGRSSGRVTTAGNATRGPEAAGGAPPPPPAPLSSTLLPQQLVNLSTLVLVSRAAGETSTGAATSNSVTHARQQPLDALSHLLTSYLSLAATQATHAANLAGRNRIAPWDVVTALGDIGYAGKRGLDELMHEASKGDEGVEPEAEQLRQLATALQDRLAPPPIQPPVCQMSYDPLNPSELDLLTYFSSLPAEGASTPAASANDGDEDGSSSSGSDSDRQQADDDATRTPPQRGVQDMMAIKAEPNSSLDVGGLDNLGDLDMANLTGGIESDAAFLDSLGLGTSSSSAAAAAGISASGGGGIGDVTASVFHPLDLAGRPIADLSILGPANLDSLASFPGFDGFMGLDLGQAGRGGERHGREEEEEAEDARPFPAWNNEADIPSYVPPFFPPFPGMERESAEALARRRRRARERERDALAAATAANEYQQRLHSYNNNRRGGAGVGGAMGGGGGGDPWAEVIPYSTSSLATMAAEFGHSLPTPSSPRSAATKRLLEAQRVAADKENGDGGGGKRTTTKRRRRSVSPPPTATTSLTSFANIQPLIPHEPTFLPPNQERRSAAGYIAFESRHPELNISSDSLFGSLPYAAPLRQATLPPGFLPDFAPPLIHPFNTNLPYTVSNPVPYHPAAPTSILPAPPPNPRLPTPLSSIARELTFPFRFDTRPGLRDQLHPNLALFARLRRIGPPGPLGPKGEALNYEYIGNTALLALSAVDWPERRHNAKLPRRFGDDAEGSGGGSGGAGGGGGGAGGEGGSGTGIKLKLGGNNSSAANMQGRQTREGSLFGGAQPQQISTPWNTFGASPSVVSTPFTTAGGDIDLAAFSASLASAPTTIDAFAPLNGTAVADSSNAGVGSGLPQADFDYPDFLLSAGGLSATGGGGGGDNAGPQTGAFDWATVPTSAPTPTPAQPSNDATAPRDAAAGTANGT